MEKGDCFEVWDGRSGVEVQLFKRGLRKEIMKETEWIDNNVEFSLDNGRRVRFWLDHWCGNSPLRLAFLDIFEIFRDKGVSMAGVWELVGLGIFSF